jgi:hypothetical protein
MSCPGDWSLSRAAHCWSPLEGVESLLGGGGGGWEPARFRRGCLAHLAVLEQSKSLARPMPQFPLGQNQDEGNPVGRIYCFPDCSPGLGVRMLALTPHPLISHPLPPCLVPQFPHKGIRAHYLLPSVLGPFRVWLITTEALQGLDLGNSGVFKGLQPSPGHWVGAGELGRMCVHASVWLSCLGVRVGRWVVGQGPEHPRRLWGRLGIAPGGRRLVCLPFLWVHVVPPRLDRGGRGGCA